WKSSCACWCRGVAFAWNTFRVPEYTGTKVIAGDIQTFDELGAHATLGEVLLALGGRLTRLQTELLAGLDQPLTIRQYRILSRVSGGHTSLTELCKLAHRNPSTMSESVDKMVNQGLLSRRRSDTSRRTVLLELTAKGRRARDAARRALDKFTTELTAGVDPGLHAQLHDALSRIYFAVQGNLDDH
ncbi:MarR family winged helix-turn-helix transcriptional regulator, partial [Mycobacterium alsense]|uniref:MarR family winged helix-turn-helix transcriptional regulator n=1 Tax=Mycobacterium alsense TaxID=324058 RepID=UPI00197BFA84